MLAPIYHETCQRRSDQLSWIGQWYKQNLARIVGQSLSVTYRKESERLHSEMKCNIRALDDGIRDSEVDLDHWSEPEYDQIAGGLKDYFYRGTYLRND